MSKESHRWSESIAPTNCSRRDTSRRVTLKTSWEIFYAAWHKRSSLADECKGKVKQRDNVHVDTMSSVVGTTCDLSHEAKLERISPSAEVQAECFWYKKTL